jgi:hypothetical protein
MCSHPRSRFFGLVILLCATAFAQGPPNDPVADSKAVFVAGHTRFTFLTPHLVRMEWSEDGKFEDRASMVFINRKLPPPSAVLASITGPPDSPVSIGPMKEPGGWKTRLAYKSGSGPFSPDNLSVSCEIPGQKITWHPGMEDKGNLLGTTRTLDGIRGATELDPGLLSRDGWTLIDDSERPLFDNSDWPWVTPRPPGKRQDWYFFCYGHDYKQALYDFTQVAGKIPLPPRFAFGTWWSRYWAYTDQEFKQLVRQFQQHEVPLDVLVVDMDWHPTFGVKWWENKKDQSGHTLGWTGYSWNRAFFPDPEGFLKWVHEQGLKVPLNLHPASGVQPHEDAYPAMARAMGIDPATKQYVPFDIASKKFTENYFNILHRPLEQQGVDFWWLDWQQEDKTSLPGVNPTWWLNYVHFTDVERRGKRGMIFHRWGGLGNHRYQIGFSGDTISVWDSLAFQPYFTATAANVLYGYWSHDIGGHMPGEETPELYTRWIQWGVFSPIVRTHTTKNPETERRIWAYPAEYAEIMRDAFVLRYALIPYIYTSAREAYDTGIAICRPMYYDYPDASEAYEARNQYMFGDNMMVAPIAAPVSRASQLATTSIWLPPGEWFEWASGARLHSAPNGNRVERNFALDQIPVFVKAGAVIPMQPRMSHTGERPVDPLILNIFPGADGSTHVYEDEGEKLGYKQNQFAWTAVHHSSSATGATKIAIDAVQGSYPGMATQRGYEIRLPGTWPPERVRWNGREVPRVDGKRSDEKTSPGWHYDGNTLTTIISLPRVSVSQALEVTAQLPAGSDPNSPLLDGVPGKLARFTKAMGILNHSWPHGWSPDLLIDAVQTGERISVNPANAHAELEKLQRNVPEILRQIETMDAEKALVDAALAHLQEMKSASIH